MQYAPVAVFVFNRPEHTRTALRTLSACEGFDPSRVHVFSDGPRRPNDQARVAEVRAVVEDMLGGAATLHYSKINRGLAASIVGGVTDLVNAYGRVVVIEDDLEVSPDFLVYVNSALERYAEVKKVMQVSGHIYPVPAFSGRHEAMFFPITTTWGWGTWKRAWDRFDPDAKGWQRLAEDGCLRSQFDLDGAYPFAELLETQMKKDADSWGIRWYWTVFRERGLVCFPPASLVRNTGMDGSGVHGRGLMNRFRFANRALSQRSIALPDDVRVNAADWESLKASIRKLKLPLLERPRRWVKAWAGRL